MKKDVKTMIDISDFEHLYDSNFFEVHNDKVYLIEKQKNENAVKEVDFYFTGSLIEMKSSFLDKTKEVYAKNKNIDFSFKRICDGIFLLENENKKYLLIVEMKSGFNEIGKKGLEQIISSSVKVKTFLSCLNNIDLDSYTECGIIVSQKPIDEEKYDVKASNRIVGESKLGILTVEGFLKKNIEDIRKSSKTVLKTSDFGLDKCNLRDNILADEINIRYCKIDGISGRVDLDKLLADL